MPTVTAVQELRHERAEAYDRMKAINDSALEAKRDLSAEESQEYDRLEERLDALTKQIGRDERLSGLGGGFGPDAATRQKAQAGDGEWTALEDEERKIPDFVPEEWRRNIERAKAEGRKAPSTFKEFNEI